MRNRKTSTYSPPRMVSSQDTQGTNAPLDDVAEERESPPASSRGQAEHSVVDSPRTSTLVEKNPSQQGAVEEPCLASDEFFEVANDPMRDRHVAWAESVSSDKRDRAVELGSDIVEDSLVLVRQPLPPAVYQAPGEATQRSSGMGGLGGEDGFLEESELEPPSGVWTRGVEVWETEAWPLVQRSRLAMVDAPSSPSAEHYRILCHRLEKAKAPKAIAVAAPRDGGDAAHCAAELALAYAEVGEGLVLVAELGNRSARLARILGIRVRECFAEQVRNYRSSHATPWQAVSAHRRNLHIMAIAADQVDGARVTEGELRVAVADLSASGYRQIVFACPRVLDSADVATYASVIDGAVLTGQAGKVTGRDLHRAARALEPAKVLGVALLGS